MNPLFNPDQVVYSFDTSSLIMASGVLYPMENFPSLWAKVEELTEMADSKCLSLFSMKLCEVQF